KRCRQTLDRMNLRGLGQRQGEGSAACEQIDDFPGTCCHPAYRSEKSGFRFRCRLKERAGWRDQPATPYGQGRRTACDGLAIPVEPCQIPGFAKLRKMMKQRRIQWLAAGDGDIQPFGSVNDGHAKLCR